jgi:capsular exopolysaccharide synthesis family protein
MHEEILSQNEVNLRDYFDLLRRRKAIIIQTFVAVLIIGIVVALVSRKVYESDGRLLITPPVPTMTLRDANDPFSALSSSSISHNIETQMQVLSSPELLAEAYRAANLAPMDSRVNVSISQAEKDVDIIEITTEAHAPEIAQKVTDSLMQLYISQDSKNRYGDLDMALQFAEQQRKEAEKQWLDAAIKLQDFQQKAGVVSYDQQVMTSTQALQNMDDKMQEYQSQLDGLNAQIAKVQDNLAHLPLSISQTVQSNNPAIPTLKQELTDLNAQIEGRLQLMKPEHPMMKALLAQKADLEKSIRDAPLTLPNTETVDNPEINTTKTTLRDLEAQKASLVAALTTIKDQRDTAHKALLNLGKQQYTQSSLQQNTQSAQDTVRGIEGRLTDLKLRQAAQSKPISVLTDATYDANPIRPKRPLIILLSALAGLFLGVCFALLQEFLDDRVNAPEDARRLLGVPVLGYIPNIDKVDQRLLTAEKTGGSVLESYRVLRSNVRFAAVGEPLQSIMVTSTAPGEGKSLTATNLAIAMALDGKRVALVDADLRRPTVHEKFGLRNTPGLTNVLVGAMSLDKAMQTTDIENLQILTSGPLPPNPAELLNSRAMEQVQEMLKERFDIIVLDSPPCLSVADAQVMAATVDGLIYVVQLGSTRKSALKHGSELLRQAHARVLGIVYNKVQVDGRRGDYYYGYYSYYHKAELPGKSNGKNGKSRRSHEWEELTAQAESQATPSLAPADTASTRRTRTSRETDDSPASSTEADKE